MRSPVLRQDAQSLGNKRNEYRPNRDLTRIHGNLLDGETRDLTDEDPVTHEPRTRPRVIRILPTKISTKSDC